MSKKIENYRPELTEAEFKCQVQDFLTILQNQGKLYFDRLNSGEFIEIRGNTRRRIIGCRKGTADFIVIRKFTLAVSLGFPLWRNVEYPQIIFLEVKSAKGKTSPAQNAFKMLVEAQGASYKIVRSVEELEEILK